MYQLKKLSSLCTLLVTTVIGVSANPALANEDCAQVEDARERLACFDRKYPRDPNKPNVVPGIQQSAPVSRTQPQPIATPSQQPEAEVAAEPAEDRRGFRSGGMLDSRDEVDFTTTIAAIRARDQQKMVFRLDNDQIWMQSSPRALPFKVGDTVTVKSGTIGGYIMRNEGGTATRVERIK